MKYEDDGLTLDYDRLKEYYSNEFKAMNSKKISSTNSQKGDSYYSSSQKETRKLFQPPIVTDFLPITPKKLINNSSWREEQEELFNASERDSSLKDGKKKDLVGLNSQKNGKDRNKKIMHRKKLKPDIKPTHLNQGDHEMEVDSAKETAPQSVNSDGFMDNTHYRYEYEAHEFQKPLISQPIKLLKKRGRKKKNVEESNAKKPILFFQNDRNPNYLVNPIPSFFEKFKTDDIHAINKHFYFDPVNLNLCHLDLSGLDFNLCKYVIQLFPADIRLIKIDVTTLQAFTSINNRCVRLN